MAFGMSRSLGFELGVTELSSLFPILFISIHEVDELLTGYDSVNPKRDHGVAFYEVVFSVHFCEPKTAMLSFHQDNFVPPLLIRNEAITSM